MQNKYGQFFDFCRDSGSRFATIPVCNLFTESPARDGNGFGGCDLLGIPLGGEKHLANLGSILFSALAILVTLFLIWRADRKRAAVGRREMQLFLMGYFLISLCEIFTVGGFPLDGNVRRGFTAVHIAAVVATSWILLLNGVIGYQLIEDGTPASIGLVAISALLIFVGSGYIALDHGFSFTHYWDSTLLPPNRTYSLYTIYLLAPLVFIVVFYLLEVFLVLRVLGETRPLIYLTLSGITFAIAQIFQFVASVHICGGTSGKINGGLFSVMFDLVAVVLLFTFWSSITEDDWPTTYS